MRNGQPIVMFEADKPLLASLKFALGLQGFRIVDGDDPGSDARAAACLVIDHRFGPEGGLSFLARLRKAGCGAPAVLLATNPTAKLRESSAAAGGALIEKPLLGDELAQTLRRIINSEKVA